eukprot:10628625-Ditylum_brightwellii.AAC.1
MHPKHPELHPKGGWFKWTTSICIPVPLPPLWPSTTEEGSPSEPGECTNKNTSSSSSSSKCQQQENAAKESCYYTPT